MNNNIVPFPQPNAVNFNINEVEANLIHQFESADVSERLAILNHISAFLHICGRSERVFWLNLRYRLERKHEADLMPLDAKTLATRLLSVKADDRDDFINKTALMLSAVLAGRNTSTEQKQLVKKLIVNLFNDFADQSEAERIEESFGYIRAVLRGVCRKDN